MKFSHLFGPVPSRRLGVSLGIDLIPFKTCSLDCVYCECGKTTVLTEERKEYVQTTEVLEELKKYLDTKPELDYITFSGSGEPTLHSKIGKIVYFIKNNYPTYKLALLTNGTLFTDKSLIEDVKDVELIIPSLDSASDEVFHKINRPYKNLSIEKIINSLTELRQINNGQFWLEVFIIPGLNDTAEEIQLLKKAIEKIKPDKIQLNTLDRPGTENWVKPASRERLIQISNILGNKSEIIKTFKSRKKVKSYKVETKDKIIDILKRRPCTEKDLAQILGLHINEITKYIQVLLESNEIKTKEEARGTFYYLTQSSQS